jgi:hypothetical protein
MSPHGDIIKVARHRHGQIRTQSSGVGQSLQRGQVMPFDLLIHPRLCLQVWGIVPATNNLYKFIISKLKRLFRTTQRQRRGHHQGL